MDIIDVDQSQLSNLSVL